MEKKSEGKDYRDPVKTDRSAARQHHHRGKSSEDHLDKNRILETLKLKPGQTVLDAGCGNGYMSFEFARQIGSAGRVFALDPDDRAIAGLRNRTGDIPVTPLVGDITTNTGLPAAAFDLIYLANVVHGFSAQQLQGFQVEVRRLLAPAGRLAIVELVKRPTPVGPPVELRFSPEDLVRILGLPWRATVEAGPWCYLLILGGVEAGLA